MPTITTQQWETWKPEVSNFIDLEMNQTPKSVYEQLASVETTTRLQEIDITSSGPAPMQPVGESGNAIEVAPLQGYTTTYSKANYRQKETFSSNLWKTDQHNEIERKARSFARNFKYSRDLWFFSMFRRGWDSTLLGGDAKSLINLSHPRKDGGTAQPNTFRDGVQRPLGYSALLLAQDVQMSAVSDTGNLLSVSDPSQNKVIVVGPKNREKAFQLAGVEGPDTKPGTAERDANYFRKGDKFDVLVTKYISWNAATLMGETSVAQTSASNIYDDMWFLLDASLAKEMLKVYVQEGYAYSDDKVNEDNESLLFYLYDMYAFGYSSWLPVFGSKADGSTVT